MNGANKSNRLDIRPSKISNVLKYKIQKLDEITDYQKNELIAIAIDLADCYKARFVSKFLYETQKDNKDILRERIKKLISENRRLNHCLRILKADAYAKLKKSS